MLRSILIVIVSIVCSIISNIFIFEPRNFISGDDLRISRLENEIHPVDSRFVVVTSMSGRYAVSVTNVKSYASGSKINLEIVNLYGVTLTGVKVNILAIPLDEDGHSNTEFKKGITETVGDIAAGTAKRKTVSIPEISPENLKMIYVHIEESGIRYKK